MKVKRVVALTFSLLLILVFSSGCASQDTTKLSKAILKQLNYESVQSKVDISVNIEPQGMNISKENAQIIDTINNVALTYEQAVNLKDKELFGEWTVDLSGIGLKGSVYTKDQKAWVKIPLEKRYIEIDPKELIPENEFEVNYDKELDLREKATPIVKKFLERYMEEFNFNFANIVNKGTQVINTPEGQKEVTLIEFKIDNNELNKLMKYYFESMITSDAVADYMKDIMLLIEEDYPLAQGQSKEDVIKEIDSAIQMMRQEAKDDPQMVQEQLQEGIDELNNIIKLGSKGIVLECGIDKDDNIITLNVLSDIIVNVPEDNANVKVTLNIKLTNYNINKTVINAPKFTKSNTITLKEYIKSNEKFRQSIVGEVLGVQKKSIILRINDKNYTKNGERLQLDSEPYIEGEYTMVPVRFIGEALGAEVDWDAYAKAAIYRYKGKEIVMIIGEKIAYVNGQPIEMPTAPIIVNGRTMVPLRFISEELGANVTWYGETKSILIEG